jgi:hydroxymethylpyrimidine pyrophosphatase-like HAD family hydrolase
MCGGWTVSWRPRLVVLDIDGTLVASVEHGGWGTSVRPSTRVVTAVRGVVRAGVPVVIATGRPVWAALPVLRAFEFGASNAGVWLVASDGGVTYELGSGRVAATSILDPLPVGRVLAAQFRHAGFAVEHGIEGYLYTAAFLRDFESRFLEQVSFDVAMSTPTARLVCRLAPPIGPDVAECFAGLDHGSCTYEIHANGWIDVRGAGVTKGRTIATLSKLFGIPARDALVIGDGTNDLPLFAWAGVAVAMGNATQVVRDAADVVTRRVDEDGVALVLESSFP